MYASPAPVPPDICTCCGEEVPYYKEHCAKGRFFGYPNVRHAQSMRSDLIERYETALMTAESRGVGAEARSLERLIEAGCATINLSVKVVRNLAMSQPYRSYYASVDAGQRQNAKRKYHAHREMVDAAVHTGYGSKIVNAALSPNGRGLSNYGDITVIIHDNVLADRASILRENAFDFFKRFGLHDLESEEPLGWRATWSDRKLLAIATLEPLLEAGAGPEDLCDAVLHVGHDRHSDRYIEVHIYDQITKEHISKFYLAKPLSSKDDELDWEFIRNKLPEGGAVPMEPPHA